MGIDLNRRYRKPRLKLEFVLNAPLIPPIKSKGTFTLTLRQGNDTHNRKVVIETHENLSFDPASTDYILKRKWITR